MEISFLKEILIPISTIVTLLSVALGALVAVFAYRLKLKNTGDVENERTVRDVEKL